MNKQRLALLNFYFSYQPIEDKEELEEYFKTRNIDIDLINEKKAKLLKKVDAKQRLIEGEKFAEKLKSVFERIRNKTITLNDLGLSEQAMEDVEFAYNKFDGDENELFQDKIKEQTRLEIIEKIKKGELK